MRIRAMWCGLAMLLTVVTGCGSTIAGTPMAAQVSGGSGGTGGTTGSGGGTDSGGTDSGGSGGTAGSGSLTEALLPDAEFPPGGTVRRLTSVPDSTTTAESTTNPPECAQKVRASQLTGSSGDLAVAVYTGSDGTVLMEALQRPVSNLVASFQDIVNTCASFQLTTAHGATFGSTFQKLPISVFDSQPSIAVRQSIQTGSQTIQTYAAVEESQGTTLYVAAVQPSGAVNQSELVRLAQRALDRKRAMLP